MPGQSMGGRDEKRFLLIDDDPVMAKLVRVGLAPAYRVDVALTGEAGVVQALSAVPDVIVCDVGLPGISGEEVVRELRRHEGLDEVPIIVLSGRGDEELRIRLLRAGAQDYLLKPLSTDELEARVDSHVASSRARRFLQSELQVRERDLMSLARAMGERTKELEAARARLETVSRRLVEVQEAERRHLARELHDQVGQVLTALKLQLEVAARQSPRDAEWLRGAVGLTNELIGMVRGLSLQLRPALLDDMGLVSALRWLFEQYQKQSGLEVRFRERGVPRRLPAEVEIALFRVAQEALTNVVRHAGVTGATVLLERDAGDVRLAIEDCGHGFDPRAVRPTAAGLTGMRERVLALEGRFRIETGAQGTRVIAEIPLPTTLDTTPE